MPLKEAIFCPTLEEWKRVIRWSNTRPGARGEAETANWKDGEEQCLYIYYKTHTNYSHKEWVEKQIADGRSCKYELITYQEFLKRYIPEEYNGDNTMKDARKAINNLDLDDDTALLQEASFENTNGTRTDEGTEALLDVLYKLNRTTLIEKLKAAKAKQDDTK